ncbi:MAG TPA: glycosyl hydrolase [Planctomycetaceae bacterium]|nr:glycosyl hydrolase [Planctomycetaceae bacterium]
MVTQRAYRSKIQLRELQAKLPTCWQQLAVTLAVASLLTLPSAICAAETKPIAKRTTPSQLQLVDLDSTPGVHVVVDREAGQYLGHPTTCLLEDGKTILCVYPKGHGKGGIVYKRSSDGGKTWSDRLATPDNWETSREVPTLHRVVDAGGKKRIIMWSGLYPARLAVSEDDGRTFSPLRKVGDWGGIVVMGCVEPVERPGRYLAMFHDDGRFFRSTPAKNRSFTLYKTFSDDGGLTWSDPESVYNATDRHLCEPGCIRSPDGKTLAVLLRENARRENSHIIYSTDEGRTFTEPVELPLSLTGDRHTGKYLPDGRIFISFRCRSPKQSVAKRPFEGDWVGWIGRWEDLRDRTEGELFIRLKDNKKGYDTAYPGVEVLPDGTVVTTTYGHWDVGEQPYIRSVRFKAEQLTTLATDAP